MKENILNRIQKYYTGGTSNTGKGFSLAMKGLKPLFTGAVSRSLGPLSLMLGANKLNANEYNSSSNPITGPSGNIMDNIMTALPEGSPEVNVDSVNTELGNIMNPYKRQMGGVEPLPGGVMAPIPGSDAVEFVGNKHDESGMGSDSGIMVDQNTEVEGGETMDEVVMNKGGARDYFFSDHLKKGGMSYAQHHKNILQNGGGQQEVNMLAKMQEKAANRDPKQVAKLGGVVEYNEGGLFNNLQDIMNQYPTYSDQLIDENADPLGAFAVQTREEKEAQKQAEIAERRRQKMDARRRPMIEGDMRTLQNLQLFVDQGRELTGEQQIKYDSLNTLYNPAFDIQETEKDDKDPFNTKQIVKQNAPEEFAKLYPKEAEEEAKEKSRLAKLLNPGMPQAAKIGLAAAFIPTIGAMLTKQKDLEKFEYTPGFESPIVAGRVRGLKYEAPNQDEARARLASSYTGEQRFLDTSGAGSSAFANRQALFAKKLQAEGTLGAQESKDQITAENLTKKSAEQAEARNVQNELTAATTNAQLIQREADRRAAVDNANVTAKNMRESEKISNRMTILNTLGQGIGTVMGDKMAYASQERMAKAIGADGIYQRDILSKYLAKQNPNMSPDEIDLLTIETLNNLQANKKN